MANGLDALRYASANARVRGAYARLLSEAAWRDLITSHDLEAAASLLKSTIYGELILGIEQRSGGLVLEQFEQALWGHVATHAQQAMTLVGGGVRRLLLVWWQQFELENLKALFRGLEQHMEAAEIRRFWVPLGDFSTLPWEALLHERTVSSLVEHLRGTHYINPLRNAYPLYQHEHSTFFLEVALDVRYYRDLEAAVKHLGGEEREAARCLLGTFLDMLNILWAFRYRVYYKLSAEEIVNYTLWRTMRTDTALMREIALGADPHAILTRVWGEGTLDVQPLQGVSEQADWLPRLELILYRHWRRLAMRQMGGYPFKLGALLGYLILQQLEARDLITLLEGKGMGWSADRIREHLIRE